LTNKNQFLHPLVGAIISRIAMVTNDIKMSKNSKLETVYRPLQPGLVVYLTVYRNILIVLTMCGFNGSKMLCWQCLFLEVCENKQNRCRYYI